MKQLTIIRHAKSSWSNPGLSDHDRPIKQVGIERTGKIVDYLVTNSFKTELIISSTALRAVQTAEIIASGIGYDLNKIVKLSSLYMADVEDIMDELYMLEDNISSVTIFGHNPAFTELVNEYLSPEIYNLPTTGTVCVEFKTNRWTKISNSKSKINFAVYPRML